MTMTMRKIGYLIIILVAAFSCKTKEQPETKKKMTDIEKIESLVLQEKYRDAITECEKFMSSHPANERIQAADYLSLCLLKTGNLNNKYYYYKGSIKEMYFAIPMNPTIARSYFQFECGITLSNNEINWMLIDGLQNSPAFWYLFEKNSIITGSERYYQVIKNSTTAKHQSNQQSQSTQQLQFTEHNTWQAPPVDREKLLQEWKIKTQTEPSERIIATGNNPINGIIKMFEACHNNKEALEAYTAIILFNKDLGALPEIAKRYNKLGYASLPEYVQEAALIFLGTAQVNDFYGFEIEERIKQQYRAILQAMDRMESLQNLKKKFGNTYTYYCYLWEFEMMQEQQQRQQQQRQQQQPLQQEQ